MTTEKLEQPQVVETTVSTTCDKQQQQESACQASNLDQVSVAMNEYTLKGWIMLNDGCPDCNTSLMRNQEATSQVCVNCEINPPVDAEEDEKESAQQVELLPTKEQEELVHDQKPNQDQEHHQEELIHDQDQDQDQDQEHHQDSLQQPQEQQQQPEQMITESVRSSAPARALPPPPPTAEQPVLQAPGPIRPMASNNRISVIDPVMESVRKAYRSPSGRMVGVVQQQQQQPLPLTNDFPRPPTIPPPRSTTPLPMPPKTPPPVPRNVVSPPPGNGVLKPSAFPRPLGPPPPLMPNHMLISPPSSPPAPRSPSRDKRRSPQCSIVVQANIQPPMSPPSRPVGSPTSNTSPSRPRFPTPPSTGAIVTNLSLAGIGMHESTTLQPSGGAHLPEEDDEKDLESHDDEFFEDAEEEMEGYQSKPGSSTIIGEDDDEARGVMGMDTVLHDSRQGSNESTSRLIGEKILQGWAMLQDPCPNPACNGVPLMRSLEKKEVCVLCKTRYQREQLQDHFEQQSKYATVPSSPVTTSGPSNMNTIASSIVSSLKTASQFPAPPTTMPPVPRATSPPMPAYRTTSPIASPPIGFTRPQRDLNGRISGPIVLPPPAPMSPSFGLSSQRMLSRHHSEDMD
ncbi:hypothetical protein BX616_003023, partial [Lobosporangium transversale]